MFGFVLVCSALLHHDTLILATLPPVFVSIFTGFVMAIYAVGTFGLPLLVLALGAGGGGGWWISRRFAARDLLIAIYLAWASGMTLALVAFSFPDRP